MSDGCCNVNAEESKRYACDSCKDNGCCNIYEYCISCCLNPQKVKIKWTTILQQIIILLIK